MSAAKEHFPTNFDSAHKVWGFHNTERIKKNFFFCSSLKSYLNYDFFKQPLSPPQVLLQVTCIIVYHKNNSDMFMNNEELRSF